MPGIQRRPLWFAPCSRPGLPPSCRSVGMLGWLHADGYDIPPSTYRSHSYSTPIVGVTAYLCPSWPRCRPSSLRQLSDALLVPPPGQRSRLPPAERSDFARSSSPLNLEHPIGRTSYLQHGRAVAHRSSPEPIRLSIRPTWKRAGTGAGWHPLQTASRFTPVRGGRVGARLAGRHCRVRNIYGDGRPPDLF